MPGGWADSTRVLPPNWQAIRLAILERDGWRCVWESTSGRTCGAKATDVDHIVRGDDHSPGNLRSLCRWHHARKSSAEGNAARKRGTSRRTPERHPGLIG